MSETGNKRNSITNTALEQLDDETKDLPPNDLLKTSKTPDEVKNFAPKSELSAVDLNNAHERDESGQMTLTVQDGAVESVAEIALETDDVNMLVSDHETDPTKPEVPKHMAMADQVWPSDSVSQSSNTNIQKTSDESDFAEPDVANHGVLTVKAGANHGTSQTCSPKVSDVTDVPAANDKNDNTTLVATKCSNMTTEDEAEGSTVLSTTSVTKIGDVTEAENKIDFAKTHKPKCTATAVYNKVKDDTRVVKDNDMHPAAASVASKETAAAVDGGTKNDVHPAQKASLLKAELRKEKPMLPTCSSEPDSIKNKLGSAVKFAWPLQTVNTAKPTKHTQTFVLKKVSKNTKLYKLPGAQYKIKPVISSRTRRNCPTIYVGAPFMTNPEDREHNSEVADNDVLLDLAEKSFLSSEKQLKSLSETNKRETVAPKDLYDISSLKNVFLPPNSDTVDTPSVSKPTLSVDTAIKNMHQHGGASMVMNRPNIFRDDLIQREPSYSNPLPFHFAPVNIVAPELQRNINKVSEYRVLTQKATSSKPQVIKTTVNIPVTSIYTIWPSSAPGNNPKLVMSSVKKPAPTKMATTTFTPSNTDKPAANIKKHPSYVPVSVRSKSAQPSGINTSQPGIVQGVKLSVPSAAIPTYTVMQPGVANIVFPGQQTSSAATSRPLPNPVLSFNMNIPSSQLKPLDSPNPPIRMVTIPSAKVVPPGLQKVIHLKSISRPKVPGNCPTSSKDGKFIFKVRSTTNTLADTSKAGDALMGPSTEGLPISDKATKRKPEEAEASIEDKTDQSIFPKHCRAGVVVEFADGVRHQVTKLSSVTYQDDEPVKSWSDLKKGTKVAALYVDGLVYDATVVRCHFQAKTDQLQPVVKTEKLPAQACNVTKPDPVKKNIPTLIMCSFCKATFAKVIAFRRHQREKCQSHGINVAHPNISNLNLDKLPGMPVNPGTTKLNTPGKIAPSKRGRKRRKTDTNTELKPAKKHNGNMQTERESLKETVEPGCKENPGAKCKRDDPSNETDVKSQGMNKKWIPPTLPDGRPIFRTGTRFLHRWQLPDGSSKWYQGKITKIISAQADKECEFAVSYRGEEDQGPYIVKLYEDYPTDIRIMGRSGKANLSDSRGGPSE